jgi:pyruvate-formate lyase-activating enzyme
MGRCNYCHNIEIPENGDKRYWVAWMMEIPDKCVC